VAYLKPGLWVRRVYNPLAMRFGFAGTQTLVVRRRQTGEPQVVPVLPIEHGGSRYLVSVRGESDWVKNLRAAGGRGEIRRGKWSGAFQATELPPSDCEPIIEAYRKKAGRAMDLFWKKLPDAADHPTFRIEY
jgi:hypothetical protein